MLLHTVSCPVGTIFHIGETESCVSCPVGYYQDLEAQLTCKVCPDNSSTINIHARSVNECISKKLKKLKTKKLFNYFW